VLLLATGLLVMHGLDASESNSVMAARMRSRTATVADVSHLGQTDLDAFALSSHLHELIGCLCVIVSGLVLALTMRHWFRGRSTTTIVPQNPVPVEPSERAPPTTVRLSLVGVSRR
jgi:hypothetical protein